jgi:sugar lactone lactonase YvrE
MNTISDTRVVLDGLRFPEGARWHDGRLWWSDMHTGQVLAMDPGEAKPEEILALDGDQTSGLGWLPDGSLLIVAMFRRHVLRLGAEGTTVHADLSSVTPDPINDMLVDADGGAWVGCFGFDLYGGAERRPAPLIRVEPSGEHSIAADGMGFPNGTVLLPGTRTLVVAESGGKCLTGFEIEPSGALSGRRTWATLPEGAVPDGTCVDAEGAVWIASVGSSEFLRVTEGGTVTDVVPVPGRLAVDCVLGGKSLYLLTSNSSTPAETVGARSGKIEVIDVSVPGPDESGA